MCVHLYIQNNYTQHTQIYYVNTNFYFGSLHSPNLNILMQFNFLYFVNESFLSMQ